MATLYNRATPAQFRILRIVAGAVKNAADSHPNISIPPTFARSVAKRAAGTLTAGWPEVLAARTPSSDIAGDILGPSRRSSIIPRFGRRRGSGDSIHRRSPYRVLWTNIAAQLWAIKRSGNMERYTAFVDILKLIDDLEKDSKNGR